MNRTLAAIQADITSTNNAIAQGNVEQWQIDSWNEQLKGFDEELKAAEEALQLEAQAQQERVQAQTEKVESITLPLDFNDLLDNALANEMIIEVVKQFQLQAYEEHNAEIMRINAAHKETLDTLSQVSADVARVHKEDKEQLQQRLNAETEQAQMDAVEILELTQQVAQLGIDKKDADSKRDAALRELSDAHATIESQQQAAIENVELKSQIEALQQELISKKAFTVNGNDKLAELASRAKESTIEKANRGLARWNLPAIEVPSTPEQIATPEIPALQEVHTFPQESTTTHTEGDPSTTGNQPVDEVVDKAAENTTEAHTVTRAEHDALVARVERIEIQANIKAVA